MKFPSIKTLAQSAANTFKRFPLAVFFAFAGTIASTINIELDNINRAGENWCIRVMIVANLGLLLSLSAALYAESRSLKTNKKYLLNLGALLIAAAILLIINPGLRQADYVRFFLLSLALHLLVAFAAFTKNGRVQGFWQFNKTLFLRFLAAALYSLVLFAGLSAAIGAMNYLFNFKFEWDTFSILFTWIIGMFSTIFFLSGIPASFSELDDDASYPKGLKVFTQYVLIPLATVYVLILLAYEIKILLEWNLPKGAVSYLILSYAVFGILSLLLVYPIREQDENKWLKTFARSFYFLLIPLLILLFIAVTERISDYGITEFRYFLMALSCWLLFITVYFLFFKKQNIKIIPISLCLVTLFSVYGPQSAFSVSMYSQRRILVDILKRNNAFKDGKFMPVKKISLKDGNRAVEVLGYLVEHHDLSSLQPYMDKDLDAVSDSLARKKDAYNNFSIESYALRSLKVRWAKDYLGLSSFSGYEGRYANFVIDDDPQFISYYFHGEDDITNIKGYEYISSVSEYNTDTNSIVHNGLKFKQTFVQNETYTFNINGEVAAFDIMAFAKKLIAAKKHLEKDKTESNIDTANTENYILPTDSLAIKKETSHYTITFAISNMRVNQTKGGAVNVTDISGAYLVKTK